ncbi:hypothetical protein [Actinophytocola oryzae]|uniref:Uncharacterized protein n=1 Tax=Actinophytocola oryzae TaxID=502181 RepID=A0A4R7W3T1_9PSEU|nr:hypothetical protein [Actinophytocola oryzae]TDV57323.1 hypothetical protein CLV71_101194 [Actinophytocola oryzae]
MNARRVLRDAVRFAQDHVLHRGCDLANVNEALAHLFVTVIPVFDRLKAMAAVAPTGPVALVLGHLRTAFGSATRGLPEPAVASMITAAATSFRLDED